MQGQSVLDWRGETSRMLREISSTSGLVPAPRDTVERMFDRDDLGSDLRPITAEPYAEPMPMTAHAIAAALRQRQPGMGVKKLHKLLYYVQGHHLAAFGQPLFRESISAWDMGPI